MAWFYRWITCMDVHKWPDMEKQIFISVEDRVTALWFWSVCNEEMEIQEKT